jgi:2-methylcitrate dehydratase
MQVMSEHGIDPHAISEILVETTTRGADILSDPSKYEPRTKETADHSLPYCIAVAATKGNVLPSDFEEEALTDPFVWEMLGKIKVVANAQIDAMFPGVKRAIVTITTDSGAAYTKQADFAKGRAESPLSDTELIDKFRANASHVMSDQRMDKIVDATFALEDVGAVGDYMNLLRRDRG